MEKAAKKHEEMINQKRNTYKFFTCEKCSTSLISEMSIKMTIYSQI